MDPLALAVAETVLEFLRPSELAGVLVDGLSKAAIYVMIAGGLTLIFGLLGVLNFAHGSFTMIGAYVGGVVVVGLIASGTGQGSRLAIFFLALLAGFAALSVLGTVAEVGLIRKLYDHPPIYQILLTFGLTLILDEAVRIVLGFYGIQPMSDWQAALGTKPVSMTRRVGLTEEFVLGFSPLDVAIGLAVGFTAWYALVHTARGSDVLDRQERALTVVPRPGAVAVSLATALAIIAGGVLARLLPYDGVVDAAIGRVAVRGLAYFEILVGLLTVAVIWLFLTRTRYGLYIRAGSEDAEMAQALGIDVRQVFTVVFALGAGLAGAAGVLLMWDPLWGASVPLSAETLLPAFVVVIIGGLGTFRGTVVAALIVGLTDAVMTWWFVNAITFTGLQELTIFLLLVVMLVVKPQGIYGVAEVGGH